jgi:hypothetical protein
MSCRQPWVVNTCCCCWPNDRSSDPALGILGLQENSRLFLPFSFPLESWTILKFVQPLLETIGLIILQGQSWEGKILMPLNKSASLEIKYWSNRKDDPHGFTVSDSLLPLLQGQSHRPLSGRTFPFSLILSSLKGQLVKCRLPWTTHVT